jgi:hypothetical protein
MSAWSSIKSSWSNSGVFGMELPYHEKGPAASYKNMTGMRAPRSGLLNQWKRGTLDMVGLDNTGVGNIGYGRGTAKYGGGLFSRGGINEITRKTRTTASGAIRIGAKRGAMGMLGRLGMKAFGPAMFLKDAYSHGIVEASKNAISSGIMMGTAKYAWAASGAAAIPLAIGAAAIGAVVGGRAALQAGRAYNRNVRQASFGNMHQDPYGNAATIRQASVMAIQGSKLNHRNAIGFEGSLLHS